MSGFLPLSSSSSFSSSTSPFLSCSLDLDSLRQLVDVLHERVVEEWESTFDRVSHLRAIAEEGQQHACGGTNKRGR